MRLLKKKEADNILFELKEAYDHNEDLSSFYYFVNNEGKVWITNNNMQGIGLEGLRVEGLGLYFCFLEKKNIRLSIEGAQLIGSTAKKNIIKISKDDAQEWIRGFNLKNSSSYRGYVIISEDDNILGVGFSDGEGNIRNLVPKKRRVQNLKDIS